MKKLINNPDRVVTEMLQGPVSYTHLDVYKRQELYDECIPPFL